MNKAALSLAASPIERQVKEPNEPPTKAEKQNSNGIAPTKATENGEKP